MQDAHLYSELLKLAETLELPSGSFSEIADAKTRIVTALGAIGLGGGAPAESAVTFTDITTNNASITKHGYLPKLSNDATKFLSGLGTWLVPAGGLPAGLTYATNLLTIGSNLANQLAVGGSATGQPVTISATGSDADIPIKAVPKGAGGFLSQTKVAFGPLAGIDSAPAIEGTFFNNPGEYDGTILNNRTVTDVSVGSVTGVFSALEANPSADASGVDYYATAGWMLSRAGNAFDIDALIGNSGEARHYGSGNAVNIMGFNGNAIIVNGTADKMYGSSTAIFARGGHAIDAYSSFANSVAFEGSGAIDNFFAFYSGEQIGATNNYYFWGDSRGVARIREDNTFDSVGQAIYALYNPLFAKYTPGAVDFERIFTGRWNNNVAQFGTEAGGTGTLRPFELIGSAIRIPLLTASQAIFTDASKNLVSKDITGTGKVVLDTSPTIVTPTIAKLANLSTDGFAKTSGGDGTLGVQANGLSETIVLAGLISITTVNGIITAHA